MSQFIVSARKYRPARFDEVVGQNHVAKTLKNALRTDHLAHAFLFCGPRGVGKTTCARILAKSINCENVTEDFEACGTCRSCQAFQKNTSFNIIELDAASHNSVDHMRSLVEQIRFQPAEGKYKVYIIDEVHMLSMSAFNAFLKTLEEPPPYAIFILATTEKHKIIPTILSRCQVFDFKRIMVPDIVQHLKQICAQEGIEAEEDGLVVIAQKADGALRDALSIFDRIVSTSEKQITYAKVIENLNLLDYDAYFKVTEALLGEDLPGLMSQFDTIQKNGFEGDIFVQGLSEHMRDLFMCQDARTVQLLDYGDALKQRYMEQARLVSPAMLMTWLDLLNTCDIHYQRAQNKRLHVEVTLAKMCFYNRMRPAVDGETATTQKKNPRPESTMKSPVQEPSHQPARQKGQPLAAAQDPELKAGQEDASALKQEDAGVDPSPGKETIGNRTTSGKKILTRKRANGNGNMIHTPKLNNIKELQEQVVRAEQEARETRKELNTENLQTCWDEYQEQTTSPSVKSTLAHARPEVLDGKIRIAVATQTARARIMEENELLDSIRAYFSQPSLGMDVWVDKTMEGYQRSLKKPKKLLSNKEKYDILLRKNPLMADLRDSLDLIVDQD